MTVGIAILGAGRIGQVHAQAVSQAAEARLVAVYDPFDEAADTVIQKHGCDRRSVEEIAAADDVQAVAICTPTDLHADQIEFFARAGKAVFCEKPIDLSVPRVRNCLKVVRETGATLMVGFNRRFDPDFKALKSSIDNGSVGSVEMITITSRDPGPPPIEYIERSGGIFRDMTIHDFDIARWLLDDPVETVSAQGSVLVDAAIGDAGDFDSANVILRTRNGRQCVITNSRRAVYGYDQRIEVHGSDGMVQAQNTHEARVEVASASGFKRPPLQNFFMERYTAAYAAEIAAFVEAVNTREEPPTTGEDGLAALVLAEAAHRSATEGRTVLVDEI